MRSIWAVMKKEILHIVRDKTTLSLIVFMPLFQLLMYGFAINTDVKHVATALYDEDQTPLSRRLVAAFEQSAYFDIHHRVYAQADAEQLLDRGRVKAVLHIPPGFTKDLMAARTPGVQLLIDGTDSSPANAALNAGQAVVGQFARAEHVFTAVEAISYQPRLWYNPDLKSTFFMIPGLIGLLLQMLVPMITAGAVVREKESGNFEQLLVTPIKPYEFIVGKLVPYIGIGMVIAALIIITAYVLFQVPTRGNYLTLGVLTILFIIVCLGIGLFASTVSNNQRQATQIVMFLGIPSMLLSGFIFPRETMPFPIQEITNIIPLTHFLIIVRGIMLKGLGVADLWPQILPLTGLSLLIITVSIRKFHKRLM